MFNIFQRFSNWISSFIPQSPPPPTVTEFIHECQLHNRDFYFRLDKSGRLIGCVRSPAQNNQQICVFSDIADD